MNSVTIAQGQSVLVSILNWNTAAKTVACVDTILSLERASGMAVEILVIDNGSDAADQASLAAQLGSRAVTLRSEAVNHGFAGGHNLAIAYAREREHDFIWLMNSDAIVAQTDALVLLVQLMREHPRCGAASPLLVALGQPGKVHFCGTAHDWQNRRTVRPESIEGSRRFYAAQEQNMWLPGTALLLRLRALAEIGMLNERLFAYYEDDDLGARLSAKQWQSLVAYDAKVEHAMPAKETDRPAYYHYLILRNNMMFWYEHTPPPYRRFIWLKLVDQAFFDVNRLHYKGFPSHAQASLLGLWDYLGGRVGAPMLGRKAPLLLSCLRVLLWLPHSRQLRKMGVERHAS